MYLARGKNGQLGRQTHSGDNARVAAVPSVARLSNVVVSNRSLAQTDHDQRQAFAQKVQAYHANKAKAQRARSVAMGQHQRNAVAALARQSQIPKDRNNELLKRHFQVRAGMTENQIMNSHMKADFYDREETPGENAAQNFSPRADFNQYAITGSPLTSDGGFGPSTDWDRFVKGRIFGYQVIPTTDDVGDGAVIVGGTMLGSYNGKKVRYKPRKKTFNGLGHDFRRAHGMGDDDDDSDDDDSVPAEAPDNSTYVDDSQSTPQTVASTVTPSTPVDTSSDSDDSSDSSSSSSSGSSSSFWSRLVGDLTTGTVSAAVASSTKMPASTKTPQAVAIASATNPVSKLAASIGVSPIVLYAGIGLIGVGIFMAVGKNKKTTNTLA